MWLLPLQPRDVFAVPWTTPNSTTIAAPPPGWMGIGETKGQLINIHKTNEHTIIIPVQVNPVWLAHMI